MRLAVLTSGGDAQGMNSAVRAVVRTALNLGAEVFAVYEGYRGLVEGGDRIRAVGWDDVSRILSRGGTMIGTARCLEFRQREGRRTAVRHLVERGIDRLVVIGGDGSLSGANLLREEWPSLVEELVTEGAVDRETADRHPALMIAGLVGSIDNDMLGTDQTVGADSALHRIIEALDAINSTAQSHQRSFVVEVMGRNCGYLALMSALAGNAAYVLIPEWPPDPGWEDHLCKVLKDGRAAGRRNNIVIVAEGAHDADNKPITSDYVRRLLEERLGEDTRVTILGHVQRGGTPSAFDRSMSSMVGHTAAHEVLAATADSTPPLVGTQGNRVVTAPLMECVTRTRELANRIAAKDFNMALMMRGDSYTEMINVFHSVSFALPSHRLQGRPYRIGVVNVGGLAPGMNAAAAAAVRLGLDRGQTMLGIHGGLHGLIEGDVQELQWGDVDGWTGMGGAELGISRRTPTVRDFYGIGRGLEQHQIDGLLIIGGWDAFEAAHTLRRERERYPAFQIPLILLPATIDNNIPGTELTVGADSALNLIVDSMDRVRQAGTASRRCFVVETMGQPVRLPGADGRAVRRGRAGLPARGGHHAGGAGGGRRADGAELPRRAADLRHGDQREGQPDVHRRVPLPAVRAGEPGPVRRPRGRPRPDPAGRHALALRPHPRHPPRGALHGLAARPDRLEEDGRRGDRDARGRRAGAPAPRHRGARRLGAPAPAEPVVDAAAPHDRRAGQPARGANPTRRHTGR